MKKLLSKPQEMKEERAGNYTIFEVCYQWIFKVPRFIDSHSQNAFPKFQALYTGEHCFFKENNPLN